MSEENEPEGSEAPRRKKGKKCLALIDHSCSELDAVLTDEQMLVVRTIGKRYRRMFTDAIREFQYYVGADGRAATRPDLVYKNMTAMVYSAADLNVLLRRAREQGKELRDVIHLMEHEFLRVVEMTAPHVILTGMLDNWTRDAIKRAVRDHSFKTADIFRPMPGDGNFFKAQTKGRTK